MTQEHIDKAIKREYAAGFTTMVEADTFPPGLNEDVIRALSAKKQEPEWMLEWRLEAFRAWVEMPVPRWAHVDYPPIDFQAISYYSSPKSIEEKRPKSLDEVDPELLATYEKLGIPLHEQAALAGVAVDVVFDSVSVTTTFREKLAEAGVLFCSISEAIQEYPELLRKHLGTVVPRKDNYYAALNSAVFSDGSFVYIPRGVRCPMVRSNRPTRASSNALSSLQKRAVTSVIWRAARRPCATRISYMRRWSNWWRWMTRKSNTPLCRTGTPATMKARAASTTS